MSSERSHSVRRIRKEIGPALFGYKTGESDEDRSAAFKVLIGFSEKRGQYERNAGILCPEGGVNTIHTRFTNPQLLMVRVAIFIICYHSRC